VLITLIDTDIYKKNVDAHPYMTGMSFVLGMYAFNFKGLIYGPLILCFSLLAKEIFKQLFIEKSSSSPKRSVKSSPVKSQFSRKASLMASKLKSSKRKLPTITPKTSM